MKRITLSLILLMLITLPVALWALQEGPTPRVEITGVDPSRLPTVIVTANVLDPLGQPILGLTESSFQITGALADRAQITGVQNVTDDNLAFSTLLVIDISNSMDGLPILRAKEAAQAFVAGIGPTDPIAIGVFGSEFRLLQDYTTDKQVLNAAIESITLGGQTALYQAAFDSVGVAAQSPTARRAVILLSDGAEYGGRSTVGRDAGLNEALVQGVPLYTIGLGYGVDRTFLEELAQGTNALFYESPSPEQLEEIYRNLATLLRSQYVITLNVDLPPDGTEYTLDLQAITPLGTALASGTLRAPVLIPIVALPDFGAPIEAPFEVVAQVTADDVVTGVEFMVADEVLGTSETAPYTFTLNPVEFLPGDYTLTVAATDEQGDEGEASATFTIGALPPTVEVNANLGDEPISEAQTVTLTIGGQTSATAAEYSIDDGEAERVVASPYAFTINPITLSPGEHTLSIEAFNEGGASTTVEVPFSVASLPPVLALAGVEAEQVIDATTRLEVGVIASQTPIREITWTLNGAPLEDTEATANGMTRSVTQIDPMQFEPGEAVLTVSATNETGGTAEQMVKVEIAALPPIITFNGLEPGELLEADRAVTMTFVSQTPVTEITYAIDGEPVEATGASITLEMLAIEPGEHILVVTAENASGQVGENKINFIVGRGPSLTATALAPTATPTPTLTFTPSPTVNAAATATAAQAVLNQQATVTAVFESTVVAATQSFEATATQMAVDFLATQQIAAQQSTESAVQAAGTARADATSTGEALAAGTAIVRETQNAQVELNAQSTANAQATRSARQTSVPLTQTAQADQSASAVSVNATQTAQVDMDAQQAGATATAQIDQANTAIAISRATQTEQVGSTVTAQAANATSTAEAAATLDQNAQLGATATAQIDQANTAIAVFQATQTEQVGNRTATAEQSAQLGATATAQIDQANTAIAVFQATQTEQVGNRTATAQVVAEQTATAAVTATAQAEAATSTFEAIATRQAEQTAAAQLASATAQQQVTLAAQAELNAQSTANAQTTRNARLTQVASTREAQAAATADQQTTVTAESRQTATGEAAAAAMVVATQSAQETSTETANASATAEREATDSSATEAAQQATERAATAVAQATIDTQLTAIGTEETEPTEEETQPVATFTPMGTLVPLQAESQAAAPDQTLPIMLIVGLLIVIIVVMILIVTGSRRRAG